MKKLSFLILSFLVMIIFTTPAMAESSSIKVFVNGKVLFDANPVVKNSRTLVPIRHISEELGFVVEYTKNSGAIKIQKDDRNIEITVDSNKAKIDKKKVELDVNPFIKENRVFVPIRFIAESLGEEVIWDGKNKIVLVGKYEREVNIENIFLYTNEENGYTLNFPNSWKEKAIIETRDGVLYVYDKKTAERFKSDGVENFGPVFEIRYSDYPVIATVPYDTNYILYYENGSYIESIFDLDFQYYPDTKDSYLELWNEGQEVLASFAPVEKEGKIAEYTEIWANALKTRDGTPRYEMMSEKAKEKFIQEQINRSGENWNYNIGYSSPWVVSFDIEIEGMTATIVYAMKTSEPANYSMKETLTFVRENGKLVVDDYQTISED